MCSSYFKFSCFQVFYKKGKFIICFAVEMKLTRKNKTQSLRFVRAANPSHISAFFTALTNLSLVLCQLRSYISSEDVLELGGGHGWLVLGRKGRRENVL